MTQIDNDTGARGDGGFVLEPGGGLVTTGTLARLIGRKTGYTPTTQTIVNHTIKEKDGAGFLVAQKAEGKWMYDPVDALGRWESSYTRPTHGGRRKGAGKKKHAGPRPLTRAAADQQAAREQVRAQLTADEHGTLPEPPKGAMRLIDVLRCTSEQLRLLVSFGGPSEDLLGNAQLDRLKQVMDFKKSQLALDKEMGQLVRAASIADAWSAEQERIAGQVQGVGKRVAGRIATACWVSDQVKGDVARLLKEHGVEPPVIAAVSTLLDRPPELTARVRQYVDDEVGRVMDEVAGPQEATSHEPSATRGEKKDGWPL